MKHLPSPLWIAILLVGLAIPALGSEAKIDRAGDAWTLSNGSLSLTIGLTDGKLLVQKLEDLATHRQLIAADHPADPFSFKMDATDLTGASGGWRLSKADEKDLPLGAKQLSIILARDTGLLVTLNLVIYPDSTVVREWLSFSNTTAKAVKISDPTFFSLSASLGEDRSDLDFFWMSGGENNPGSWLLKKEALKADKPRLFDSYDPFPSGGPTKGPGDGIDAKIELNGKQIWPASGWQYVADATQTAPFDLTTDVAANDSIVFRVNMHQNIGWDTTAFDPTIAYADGETHVASKEFSDQQGKSGWKYQYIEAGKSIDMAYYPGPKQWRKAQDNATGTPFIGVSDQHPDAGQDSVRVWTAPHAGRVHITGSVCNTGNKPGPSGGGSGGGFKPGTASYAPWYSLFDRTTKQGVVIGWDYFGHWASSIESGASGTQVQLRVAGYHQELQPSQSFDTPAAFFALYHDDLDAAGNEILDWQYRYLWDQTRDGSDGRYPWFPALRTLGFWMKGTGWGKPGVAWTGGKPDLVSTYRKVFRVADYMRETGVDVYHRDWGWWDVAGDWNGPDFKSTNEYLHKSGMGELIYAFLYTVAPESAVARDHPDWVVNGTLDMSRPEVVKFMAKQLDDFVGRWGDFEWRNDSFFTAPKNGDDTALLAQDQGFRRLLEGFLTKYPNSAFQAVNGGGNYCGYDYVRYASTISFSDGAVGPLRNYWAALLFPPDKTSDIPDLYNPDAYDKSTWRGLLCINYDTTGDTWNRDKLDGIRQLNDIYHYLLSQGVVGRWVHVFRPVIDGDDETMYFERLSRDGKRGIIIPKHQPPGPIGIHPRGLNPDQTYNVSYQESDAHEDRTGADLMKNGIALKSMPAGELIYLNLPLHPGSKLDTTPPLPPSDAKISPATNMGFPGIELTWKPGSDDNWVSCYEILRDGVQIDRVAKGTYYFDHSAGADLAAQYAVKTVDGAGNISTGAVAEATAKVDRSQIIDDATEGGFTFTGNWTHAKDLQPAYANTISLASAKGDAAVGKFHGKHVRLFSKLGGNCGIATVTIDNDPPQAIDTYDADDLWGICILDKELPAGDHTIRIEVSGDKNPAANGTYVHLDGLRAEP